MRRISPSSRAKLREARARQNAIAARFESAVARAKAREIMHGSRTEDAFSKFELLERRADFAEGRAEALGIQQPRRRNSRAQGRRNGRSRARSDESRAEGAGSVRKGRGMTRKIYPYSLDRKDAKIAGVCSTLGNRFGIDPTFIRIGFVAAAIFHQLQADARRLRSARHLPDAAEEKGDDRRSTHERFRPDGPGR